MNTHAMDYKSLLNFADKNHTELQNRAKNKQNAKQSKGPDSAAILAFREKMARKKAQEERQKQLEKERLLALRSQNSKSQRKQVAMATRTKDNNFAKIKVTSSELAEQEAVNRKLTKQGILDKNERMKAKMELDKKVAHLTKKERDRVIAKFERDQQSMVSVSANSPAPKKTIKDIIQESKGKQIKRQASAAPPMSYDQILNMASQNSQKKRTLEQEIHEQIRETMPKPESIKEKKPDVPVESIKNDNMSTKTTSPNTNQTNGKLNTFDNRNNKDSAKPSRQPVQSSSSSNAIVRGENPRTTTGNGLRTENVSRQQSQAQLSKNITKPTSSFSNMNDARKPKLPPIYSTPSNRESDNKQTINKARPSPNVQPSREPVQQKKHSMKITSTPNVSPPNRPLPPIYSSASSSRIAPPSMKGRMPPPPQKRPYTVKEEEYRPMKKFPPIYSGNRRPEVYYDEDEEEDEYDEEMDDFIDDGPIYDEPEYSKEIAQIFGYNKRKYIDMDDDDIEEASFAQCMKEEKLSSKIGLLEDLEDIRREEEEKKAKLARKKYR